MAEHTDEWQFLAESIGHCSADMLGRDHLHALTVVLDSRARTCTIFVELHKNSSEERLRAMRRLIDVEGMFLDEVTMSFDFVEDLSATETVLESQRQFVAV